MTTESKLDFTEYNDPSGLFFPEHMRNGLELWVEHGIMPGGFLTSVLTNDLFGALSRADETNRQHIHGICSFIYNHIPGNTWGSVEIMEEWQKTVQGE